MNSSPKIKTEWDLTLLYKSSKDPQIEIDITNFTKNCEKFAKKYKNNKSYLENEDKLLESLQTYEKLLDDLSEGKPLVYYHYRWYLDSNDKEAIAQKAKLIESFTKAENEILFYPLSLGKISESKQKIYLKSTKLKKFRHLLNRRFINAKYDLPEEQEKILNLTSNPGFIMWKELREKQSSKKYIKYKGKKIPLSEAMQIFSESYYIERRELYKLMLKEYKTMSDIAEAELNAIVAYKKITDELKGLKDPFDSRIISNENEKEVVLNLIRSVTDNLDIGHKFSELKAKFLKLDKLEGSDRFAKIGEVDIEFSVRKGVEKVSSVLEKIHPEYSKIFRDMLKNGQIDFYPRQGKYGGGFLSSTINAPSYILLNYTNKLRSVETLAHEMGHAIHSHFAKSQPVIYQDYSLTTAETASQLVETLVKEAIFRDLDEKYQIIFLHDKIKDDTGAIFTQVACFKFEEALHTKIRSKGFLSKDEMRDMYLEIFQNFGGNTVKLKKDDGYNYVDWPHIRSPFYVYSYAYGQLAAKVLIAEYKRNNKYIEKINEFFKAGSSDTPENLFKNIGIDLRNTKFFEEGLDTIREDLNQLERLIKMTI